MSAVIRDRHVVILVEPDPAWPADYLAERDRLLAAVESRFPHLEHIGSTAVPGLVAKPTIDLLASIASEASLPEVVSRLEPLGYEHRPRIPGDVDVALFRRLVDDRRTHHLHVVLADSFASDARLRFRDILRARPDIAAAYGALKRELAARLHTDRPAYTDAKTDFVTGVLRGE